MRFILGLLLGYCIRGKKPLLAATLTTIAIVCFIVLPAIALSQIALSVRRERLSRPPQTRVPSLIGLNYDISETIIHKSNLKIRLLANRYDLSVEPGVIISQTPQAGELVDHGTIIGVTISKGVQARKESFLDLRPHALDDQSKKLSGRCAVNAFEKYGIRSH